MQLVIQQVMGTTYMAGFEDVVLKEKETVLIVAPEDIKILSATVPEKKQWVVRISVEVFESNAS